MVLSEINSVFATIEHVRLTDWLLAILVNLLFYHIYLLHASRTLSSPEPKP